MTTYKQVINELTGEKQFLFNAKLLKIGEKTLKNSNGKDFKIVTLNFNLPSGEEVERTAICYESNYKHGIEDGKSYGYIIDYKDLFKSLQKSITDYTSQVFDKYDEDDVKGLLKDRYTESKERLETALEALVAMCEPVHPKDEPNFIKFFCGNTEDPTDIKNTEEKRVGLYKAVVKLIRAYANVANEMYRLGYSEAESNKIKGQVKYYSDLREIIKRASGDYLDFKRFEPGMRQLMDMYLDANSSKKISDFENKSLVDLIVKLGDEVTSAPEEQKKGRQTAVAETIENNVRKVINEESQTNPKYYEKMSVLLNKIILERKQETIDYQNYLEKIKQLANNVSDPTSNVSYPATINTKAKQALYDNLDNDEELSLVMDEAVRYKKLDGWRDGGIKEKKLSIEVNKIINDPQKTMELMDIIKAQSEY